MLVSVGRQQKLFLYVTKNFFIPKLESTSDTLQEEFQAEIHTRMSIIPNKELNW